MNSIYAKNYVNNSLSAMLYRYGNYYDSLETDISIDLDISNQEKTVYFNNKMFRFVSEIYIKFNNDFDNKTNFKNLPIEINKEINSYLIDEKSFLFNFYKLNQYYNINCKLININKSIIYNLKFYLNNNYQKKISNLHTYSEFINKIPIYITSKKLIDGLLLKSLIKRKINITIKYMNYNNENFYNYESKFLECISSL